VKGIVLVIQLILAAAIGVAVGVAGNAWLALLVAGVYLTGIGIGLTVRRVRRRK
jgi:hypothetical protein